MCVKSVHFLWGASDVTPASSQPSCCPRLAASSPFDGTGVAGVERSIP